MVKERVRRRRGCRIMAILMAGFVFVCLLASLISALSNLTLPSDPENTDRLSALDKARLAEALHLKDELGDEVWPGWGTEDIPVIIWNRDYSFLVGAENLPKGWELVAGDSYEGNPYYRQRSVDPQNFAVPVNGYRAASMATKDETDKALREIWQEVLPPPLEQIFPYRVLIQPSEVQITAVLHESFHVFQMELAEARLADAERAYRDEEAYWSADEEMDAGWSLEIDLLVRALEAESDEEAAELAGQFLGQRDERRQSHRLEPELVALEQRNEWLEGLAKYLELEAWRQAATAAGYEPLGEMESDPDFKAYESFEQRWSQEIGQMKRQAGAEGVTRFYYTGMAQATLLDRLYPGWKSQVMEEGIWLETMLREVTG